MAERRISPYDLKATSSIGGSTNVSASKRRKIQPATVGHLPFLCVVCKEPFRRRDDLWQHLTTKETGVNIFTCLDCLQGFCKERLLRDHLCGTPTEAVVNAEQHQALSVFCHIIVCQECGIFVALVNVEIPSWRSYTSFCTHSSRSFKKITLYTWTSAAVRFIRSDLSIPFNIFIDAGPAVSVGIPIFCKLCREPYTDAEDVEEHILENHPSVPPIQCPECPAIFHSAVRMEIHSKEKHGKARIDLMDFLKIAVIEEPYVDQTALGRTGSHVPCDLCGLNFLANEFNSHDCVKNYTRRYLTDGEVIYCPAIQLPGCEIDMGIQHPFLISLSQKHNRHVELCLRFFVPVVAPKIDDIFNDVVYSCKHCECIFINPTLLQEHVTEVFQERRINISRLDSFFQSHDSLSHFGMPVTVDSDGLFCPKLGCSTKWCSTIALERHIKSVHADTFETMTVPNTTNDHQPLHLKTSTSKFRCPICVVYDFNMAYNLRRHIMFYHKFICVNCASCFISEERLLSHKPNCPNEVDAPNPICYCPICKNVFTGPDDYYRHLISDHSTNVQFNNITGEMLPQRNLFLQPTKPVSSNGMDTAKATSVNRPKSILMYSLRPENHLIKSVQSAPLPTDGHVVPKQMETVKEKSNVEVATTSRILHNGNSNQTMEDDEVVICDPDTESGTSGTGRLPTYGCLFCCKKFYTEKGAQEHLQCHASDTGETTDLVLPVPDDRDVFICRQCCLAYECRTAFKRHGQKHRKMHSCDICSAIALNPQHLEAHKNFHETVKAGFGCAICLKAMRSETTLMLHMNETHNMSLVWFCLVCGLGNTNWSRVQSHVCEGTTSPIVQLIFPAARRKLHFQPRRKILENDLSSIESTEKDVAECVHRTFLGCKETAVSCTTCGSIVPASNYFLETGQTGNDQTDVRFLIMNEMTEQAIAKSHPSVLSKVVKVSSQPQTLVQVSRNRPILPKPTDMPVAATAQRMTVYSIGTNQNNSNTAQP